MSTPLYGVLESGGLGVVGEYNPGDADEIDRQVRNLPEVVGHITAVAHELLSRTGSVNFEVIVSTRGSSGPNYGPEESLPRRSWRRIA